MPIPTSPFPHRRRALPLLRAAACLGLVLAAGGVAGAEDETPAPLATDSKTLMCEAQEDPKAFKTLVDAARLFFDPEVEPYKGRKAFLQNLEALARAGRYPLTEPNFTRWLAYQGRAFLPDMRESKWRKDFGVVDYKAEGPYVQIKTETLYFAYSLPKTYPSKAKDFEKFPRDGPYPTVLLLHDKDDYSGKKHPGIHALKRVYPKEAAEFYDNWIGFVPIAAAGNYATGDGQVRVEALSYPFGAFVRHYHVDFERVILDGGEAALTAAPSLAAWFAGVVLRGPQLVKTDAQRAAVKNWAHVPVYVVGCPHTAKSLQDAGHPNVTLGNDADVLAWMAKQRRTTPRKFSWTIQSPDQTLAYWVNFDAVGPATVDRGIDLEVLDTAEAPNTIKIEARGVSELSLFLNDEIVALDRPVRVVINGHVEHDGIVPLTSESVAPVKRDLDVLFNREPAKIRQSMWFGFLYPARIVRLEVQPPEAATPVAAKSETPEPAAPPASAEEEEMAKRLKEKAGHYLKEGDSENALKVLQRIVDMPANQQTTWAKERLAELQGK